jgi:ABC-type polysaccharide/polyol phosphate export permease
MSTSHELIFDSTEANRPALYQFKEVWQYRHLVGNLISRDLKVRYKRSVLGFVWTMLNPLLTMTVLAIVFSTLFRFQIENYVSYVLIGLLLWNFFSQATSMGMSSIADNSMILTKIYVPPSVFTLAGVGGALVNLFFATGPLLIVGILTGLTPNWRWLFIIVPVLQLGLVSTGLAYLLATLRVYFQDMVDIYSVVLNLYFYLSPIIYPLDMAPDPLRFAQRLNPFYYPLNGARQALMYQTLPSLTDVAIGTVYGVGLFVLGWSIFARMKREFTYHL